MNWNDVADRIRIHRCMEMRRCDSCGCRNKKGLNPCQHAEAMACSCDKIADNLPAEHTPEEIVHFLHNKTCGTSRATRSCNHRGCITTEKVCDFITEYISHKIAA